MLYHFWVAGWGGPFAPIQSWFQHRYREFNAEADALALKAHEQHPPDLCTCTLVPDGSRLERLEGSWDGSFRSGQATCAWLLYGKLFGSANTFLCAQGARKLTAATAVRAELVGARDLVLAATQYVQFNSIRFDVDGSIKQARKRAIPVSA